MNDDILDNKNSEDEPAAQTKLGRPPLSKDEPTVRLNASLTVSQLFFLKEYGNNNASRGVQRLVDEKREEMDKTDA